MKRQMIAAAGLLLASCGPKTLALPEQPVDRAATCAVVAAAEARQGTDIKQVLPFEAQGRILHYALIAGSQGGTFSAETATSVSKRMSELQGDITSGKWQDLAPACRQAFPETAKTDVTLPQSRFEAQLACDELGSFMGDALRAQEADYGNELAEYSDLNRTLDAVLGPGLASRAGAGLPAQQEERRKALAAAAKLGSPTAVMRQCVGRFGRT